MAFTFIWSALGVTLMNLVLTLCVDNLGVCTFNPFFLRGTCSAHYTDPAALLIENVFLSLAEADCELGNPCNFPPHYSPRDWEEFDFIVVGAGAAGSVVANRLSEIAGWTVLLLEAGGDPPKTAEVPALRRFLLGTDVDWQYLTDSEEPNCLGSEGSQCKWSRAKMLGGCTSHNGLVYIRGNPRDYDGWASEGNYGWGFRDVLPYFKKSEDMKVDEVKCTQSFSTYHGVGGPLKIEDFNIKDYEPLIALMSAGFAELGYSYNPDPNGRLQSGFCRSRGTLIEGRRCSTANAFLSPIKNRGNFKLSKYSLVTKILIDEIKKIAYGVQFVDRNGNIINVLARKEVIVSGGTVNSPQLLMLSGIGPREHLTEFGIKVISDLPVGNNLQDQPRINGIGIGLNYKLPDRDVKREMFNFLLKYNDTFPSLSHEIFMDTCYTGVDYPDVQVDFLYNNKNMSSSPQELRILGFNEEVIQSILEMSKYSAILTMIPNLVDVKSRGKIRLESRNPMQHPKITSGYFADQRDIDTLIKAINFLRSLTYTKPFVAAGARFYSARLPSCLKYHFDSRPYWECFLRHIVSQVAHIVGTCRMGPLGHPEAVVDPELRVLGVGRLRVIDASVMPTVPRGNTAAPTIMIGEKGSDLIKHTWLSTPYSSTESLRRALPQPLNSWEHPV